MTPEDIKDLRIHLGMTQKALAQLLDVTPTSVNRWENGKCAPLGKVARQLDEMSLANPRRRRHRKKEPPHDFTAMVDHWTTRLAAAIPTGEFRNEVAVLLYTVMRESHGLNTEDAEAPAEEETPVGVGERQDL